MADCDQFRYCIDHDNDPWTPSECACKKKIVNKQLEVPKLLYYKNQIIQIILYYISLPFADLGSCSSPSDCPEEFRWCVGREHNDGYCTGK